jgi:uncharacterized protein YjiS (DUF1127 family)
MDVTRCATHATGAASRHDGQHRAVTTVRRIFAVIRLWRERSSSRHQLRELDDYMLKDIGLTREDLGREFPRPLWQ